MIFVCAVSSKLDKLVVLLYLVIMSGKSELVTQITPVWLKEKSLTPPTRIVNIINLAGKLYSETEWEETTLSMHRVLLIPFGERKLIGIGWGEGGTRLVVQTWESSENGESKPLTPEGAVARHSSIYNYPSKSTYYRTPKVDSDWLKEVDKVLLQAGI